MWPDRRLCDLLGIEHPIIQAPMTGTCTPALASAVADAGTLGSLGCAGKDLETIRLQVGEIRDRTIGAFILNFFVTDAPKTDPAVLESARQRLRPWFEKLGLGEPPSELPAYGPGFDEARLDLVLDLKPRVVSFHFGCPDRRAIDARRAKASSSSVPRRPSPRRGCWRQRAWMPSSLSVGKRAVIVARTSRPRHPTAWAPTWPLFRRSSKRPEPYFCGSEDRSKPSRQ